MSSHSAKINWQRDGAVFSDAKYSRAHILSFDGGISVAGSSAPEVVKPPLSKIDAIDPEEMLVASAASCHMLFFLDFARREGLIIDSYEDNPIGHMGKLENGKIGFTSIELNPKIVINGEMPNKEIISDLHHKAHEACYIANTLNCPIIINQ